MRTLAAAIVAVAIVAPGAAALARTPLEIAIKATYLYKFGPFVEWPATSFDSPTSPLNLCVVGTDPFGAVLDQAAQGQRLAAHPIVVRRLAAPSTRCHIAYIEGTDAFVAETLEALRGSAVLTVTDRPRGAATRGIINFVVEANHVRFDIDESAASRSGLNVSSKLLTLARAVRTRS
jgi:hypothetical protein